LYDHSQRVTDLTLRLARVMRVADSQLIHLWRGALLHDIGKLGIPDTILQKPGALTPDERAVMCKHPVYAYEWLAPIPFLHPALDIPAYHHEKWDGSGYPYGLRGMAIPLAARLFAVVDVWDALTHDRPYRAALPAAQARDHIQAQAGSHFDPDVVPVFLRLVQEG
jgi:putative two-component system response regulator